MIEGKPAFEIVDFNGRHYKIWADGRTEGFEDMRPLCIINRIPVLLGEAVKAAAVLCEKEADACIGDIVPGDEIGRREANARAGSLLTAAGDIRDTTEFRPRLTT